MRFTQHWTKIFLVVSMVLAQTFCVGAQANSSLGKGTKQFRVNNQALAEIMNMQDEFQHYEDLVQNTTDQFDKTLALYPRADYDKAKVELAQLNLAHELRNSQSGGDVLDEALAAQPNFTVELTGQKKKHTKVHTKPKHQNINKQRQLIEKPSFDSESIQKDLSLGQTLLETNLDLVSENLSQHKPQISVLL